MRRRLTLACLVVVIVAPATQPLAQRGSPTGDWTHQGGDAGSTKYAPLDQITPENAASLRIAWRRPGVDPELTAANPKLVVPRNFRATPLKVDGMLFASNAIGLAEAIEPESGRTVWTQEVPARELEGPGASRTLAYWRGDGGARLFTVRGGWLYALDPRSGKPIATFGTAGRVDLVAGLGSASTFRWAAPSPLVVRDVVIIGGQGWTDEGTQEHLPPGDVRAFDARTGKLRWRFHVVPRQGEAGIDTWERESWKETGSAKAWNFINGAVCQQHLQVLHCLHAHPRAARGAGGAQEGKLGRSRVW